MEPELRQSDRPSRVGAEVDPRLAGMTEAQVERIWDAVVRAHRSGAHPAMALCIRREGHVVLDRAIGHARPDVAASHETPFCIFSASKAVAAMIIHLLEERGLLKISDRVARYAPEFAANGKSEITISQVLSHRAGLQVLPSSLLDFDVLADDARVMDVVYGMTPTSVPGSRQAYHALTGGFMLAEVVRRVTGSRIDAFLETEILEPLGFRWMRYGARADEVGQVAVNQSIGHSLPPLEKRLLGTSVRDVVAKSNDPRWLDVVVPAGNIVSTANEVSRFYELLRMGGELDGVRIFQPETLERALGEPSRAERDGVLQLPVRFSGGFMMGAKGISPFGRDTAHAFGHPGLIYMPAWADPERAMSASLLTSGKGLVHWGVGDFLKIISTINSEVPKV